MPEALQLGMPMHVQRSKVQNSGSSGKGERNSLIQSLEAGGHKSTGSTLKSKEETMPEGRKPVKKLTLHINCQSFRKCAYRLSWCS